MNNPKQAFPATLIESITPPVLMLLVLILIAMAVFATRCEPNHPRPAHSITPKEMRYDFTENVSNEHLGILLEVENIENAWLALKARVLPTAYNLYLTRERKTTFQDALEEIKEAFDFYESITHHNTPQDDR